MVMEKTTLYLPAELQRRLSDAARRTGRTQADLIREALRLFLGELNTPPPRSLGILADPELRGEDTEDWLRGAWDAHRDKP
jgi:Arc/MetJ-type ribon-helix-helix transcriptional regulator